MTSLKLYAEMHWVTLRQKYAIEGDCFNDDLTKLEQMCFKTLIMHFNLIRME